MQSPNLYQRKYIHVGSTNVTISRAMRNGKAYLRVEAPNARYITSNSTSTAKAIWLLRNEVEEPLWKCGAAPEVDGAQNTHILYHLECFFDFFPGRHP